MIVKLSDSKVVAVGGLIVGAFLGAAVAVPQSATNGALALSGLIVWPNGSLMGQFLFGFWSLLHQFGAVALLIGATPQILNVAFCGISTGLIVSAFALVIHSVCANVLKSIIGAAFCFMTGFLTVRFLTPDFAPYGSSIAIISPHTYSMFAMAMMVWSLAALSVGWYFATGLVAALTIAVQAVLGLSVVAALIPMVAIGLFIPAHSDLRKIGVGLLCGLLISALSGILYLMSEPAFGPVDEESLRIYVSLWDSHTNAKSFAFFVAVECGLVIAALAIFAASRKRLDGVAVFCVTLAIYTLGAMSLYLLAHASPISLPRIVHAAVPGRFLFVPACLGGACVVALLAGVVRRTAVFIAVLLVFMIPSQSKFYLTNSIGRIAAVFTEDKKDAAFWTKAKALNIKDQVLVSRAAEWDAMQKGMLPVLFPGRSHDFVRYLPSLVAEVRRELEIGFGLDFKNPPANLRFRGENADDTGRAHWEELSPSQWNDLSSALNVKYLLVPGDYRLSIQPIVAETGLALYRTTSAP